MLTVVFGFIAFVLTVFIAANWWANGIPEKNEHGYVISIHFAWISSILFAFLCK